MPSERLPQTTLHEVATHGIPHPPPDREADAEMVEFVGQGVDQQRTRLASDLGAVDLREARATSNPPAATERLIDGAVAHESASACWYSRMSRVRVRTPITRPPSR